MARGLNRLTARTVASKNTPGRYADGGGLWLQVTARGTGAGVTKSWLFRFTMHGTARQMGLGSLNTVTLSEAREAAADARKQVQAGINPIEARRTAKAAAKAAADQPQTFRTFAEEYIRLNRDGWKNAKHRQQWENTLETYAYPVFGDVHVDDVTKAQVMQAIEPIWSDKTETARRVRSRIETVLDMAIAADARKGENPARLSVLKFLLPSQGKARAVRHHPALPYAEMGDFMAAVRKREDQSARALEFLILTASRTGEVLGARWDEFDTAAAVWTVPAERMKSKRVHRVPLTKAALAVLEALPIVDGSPFLFPSTRGERPLSNMAMLKMLARMGRSDITVHGFRSAFRDWAAEQTGYPREVAEAALAHVNADKVEAAYLRGDLFDKRRKLMEAWAAYCAVPTKKAGNVTPIRKRAG